MLQRANLATLINAPATTTATGVALTGSALRLFQNQITATNDNTANTLYVVAKGVGVLDVSSALTDGTDTWTATSQLQHNLFGVVGNPSLVIQREPKHRWSTKTSTTWKRTTLNNYCLEWRLS